MQLPCSVAGWLNILFNIELFALNVAVQINARHLITIRKLVFHTHDAMLALY